MLQIASHNLKIIFGILLLCLSVVVAKPTQTVNQNTLPEIKVTKIHLKHLSCLAKNIFYEARGEPYMGQVAVALVVMNRVTHGFASNPCNVIYQKTKVDDKVICQFSWVCTNNIEPNKNNNQYKLAKRIAYEVMIMGMHKDTMPKSALFFHSVNIDPQWSLKKVKTIGGHVFYSNKKTKLNKI